MRFAWTLGKTRASVSAETEFVPHSVPAQSPCTTTSWPLRSTSLLSPYKTNWLINTHTQARVGKKEDRVDQVAEYNKKTIN